MKLDDAAVTAQADNMRSLLSGALLQLWDGETLLAALAIGEGTTQGDAVTFGPMRAATAKASGTPSLYRIVGTGGELILEGDAADLTLEPTSEIELGAAVSIAGMTYRQPAGSL